MASLVAEEVAVPILEKLGLSGIAPSMIPKQSALFGTSIMIIAIIIILIGILIFSVKKSKTPGIMILFVGFLLGAGGLYLAHSS